MLTIEDGIVIDPVSRATPTHGRDLGLLEQLLGNIGRFDAPGTTAQFPNPEAHTMDRRQGNHPALRNPVLSGIEGALPRLGVSKHGW